MYCNAQTPTPILKSLLKFDSPVMIHNGEFSINENHQHTIAVILDVVSLPIGSDARIDIIQSYLNDYILYEYQTLEVIMALRFLHFILYSYITHKHLTFIFNIYVQ
jgi:hypothetical protein